MAHTKLIDRFFENHRRERERRIHESLWSAFKKDPSPQLEGKLPGAAETAVPRRLAGKAKGKN